MTLNVKLKALIIKHLALFYVSLLKGIIKVKNRDEITKTK